METLYFASEVNGNLELAFDKAKKSLMRGNKPGGVLLVLLGDSAEKILGDLEKCRTK